MLIYLIVPIYNVEKYLKECLDSIQNQTYQNFKAILVDDGSTDSSQEIAKAYLDDPRFSLIVKENGGLSSARNAGLKWVYENAKNLTDYVVFLDSDDMLEGHYFEKMIQVLQKHQDSDLILGGVQRIDEQSNILEGKASFPKDENKSIAPIDYLSQINGNYFCFSCGGGGG